MFGDNGNQDVEKRESQRAAGTNIVLGESEPKGWKPTYHSDSSNTPRGPQVSSSRYRGPAGHTACHSPSFHTPSHSQAQPDRLPKAHLGC